MALAIRGSQVNRNGKRASIFGVSLMAMGAALTPTSALAQTETAEEATEEEIVIVGSRLRRDNFTTDAPVQVITREENTLAGLISSTEALQSNAVTSGAGQIDSLFGGFVVNGGNGVNTLGLRGFGPTSTLILLNGRRLTPAGTRGAVGAADLNTIPTALVDSIMILKDGASSIYGSDAVAGVVNIITNDDLEGFVLEGQHNFVEAGGGEQTRVSLAGGGSIGALSLIGSVEYYDRAAQLYRDREWSRCPGDGLRDPATGEPIVEIDPLTGEEECWSINFTNSAGVTVNTIGTATRPGFGGPGAPFTGNFNRWRPNSFVGDGTPGGPPDQLDGFEGVNGGGFGFANRDTFDPRMLDQDFFSPANTLNVFLAGAYDLGGSDEFYGELLFSRRESTSTNFIQLSLDYPNNPLLPAELRTGPAFLPSALPVPGPVGYPAPADYPTQVRAFIGLGNMTSSQEVEYTRLVGGIRGDLDAFEGWNYDLVLSYGRNEGASTTRNFLVDRLFNSLVIAPAAGGEPPELVRTVDGVDYVCEITLVDPSYGCIPAPALTTDTVAGRLPTDWLDWAYLPLTETNIYDEASLSLVFDGPLFTLPAGEVLSAWGVEIREGTIDATPSDPAQNFNVYNFTSGGPTRGSDAVREVFGEVEIPILADAPLAQSLTANVSGRYTDYDSYGSDSTYKVGGTWSPMDGLTFRATRGTSYRAPALFEQFLGPTTGFQSSNVDPCDDYGALPPTSQVYINCDAELGNPAFIQTSGITVFGGGGAATGLFAETSDNSTIGVIWRPLDDRSSWGELSFAADRFSIELNDSIARIGPANILTTCYNDPNQAAQPLCTLFTRDPVTNRLTVFDNFTNIASQMAEGWDYGLRYIREVGEGELTTNVNVTQFTTQDFQLLPTFAPLDFNGRLGFPEMSGNAVVNYELGPWLLHYGMEWVQRMDESAAFGVDESVDPFDMSTEDYFLHDASVRYSAENYTVIVGVRNLLDEQPDRISALGLSAASVGATPLFSGFDYAGRQFFVNIQTRF